jgi:aminoglycoside 6'-N-acetyltransferase
MRETPPASFPGLFPIWTDRFVLRPLRADDAPTIAAYRSDPTTAHMQSWSAPYPVEKAQQLVAETIAIGAPTDGEWYAVGIADAATDELLGDVAIHLEWDGHSIEVGYTLKPDARGRGLATEATGAVIDALFSAGVARARASLHPDNHPSARVLERLGFLYEGTDRQAYWSDGVASDDVRYGMLAADRAAWLARPRFCQTVELVEIDEHVMWKVLRLKVHHSQERFVAPNAQSLAEARIPQTIPGTEFHAVPWYRAIAADGDIVGFLMLSAAGPGEPHPFLWRLMIDRMHQHRGVGRKVMELMFGMLRANGHAAMVTSWTNVEDSPGPFYERLGFVRTGNLLDGEVEAIRTL